MTAQPADDAAIAVLQREISRVQACSAARAADPALARALARLADWQVRRMRATYADLNASTRYAPAMTFFTSDLYGSPDFARRDGNLMRGVPAMRRLLPGNVLQTVVAAVELNALSRELDRAMIDRLAPDAARFTVADYCNAYRGMREYHRRERQIRLVGDVGAALDRYVRKPMLRGALTMMRGPARIAGLSALQDFLERGFAAFAHMRGAADFLATIESRETALHDAIVGGADDPFPDPMA
jgi:hypothetical protein